MVLFSYLTFVIEIYSFVSKKDYVRKEGKMLYKLLGLFFGSSLLFQIQAEHECDSFLPVRF